MLLVGNGRVFTLDPEHPYLKDGAVVIDNEVIREVGLFEDMKKKYPDAEFVDAHGQLILPGFINAHTHIYSGLARGLAIDGNNPTNFFEVLDGTWWNIDRHLTLDGTRACAYATILDCIRDGVTTIFDHHASFLEIPGSLFAIKDVAKELEDYRVSLLKYRYEQLYVNERLDTAVSDDKIEEYYEIHKERFRLARPLVKARFLRIHTDSPMLETIRKKMDSSDANDLIEADSLAFSSAIMFTTWRDEWQDVIVLAKEMGVSYDSVLGMARNGWIRQDDTTGVTNLAFVSETINSGDYAPVSYTSARIKDIIISTRKQALISSLEQDLLKDAHENGKIVIY
jgi:hypothetical protein